MLMMVVGDVIWYSPLLLEWWATQSLLFLKYLANRVNSSLFYFFAWAFPFHTVGEGRPSSGTPHLACSSPQTKWFAKMADGGRVASQDLFHEIFKFPFPHLNSPFLFRLVFSFSFICPSFFFFFFFLFFDFPFSLPHFPPCCPSFILMEYYITFTGRNNNSTFNPKDTHHYPLSRLLITLSPIFFVEMSLFSWGFWLVWFLFVFNPHILGFFVSHLPPPPRYHWRGSPPSIPRKQ